MHKEDNQFENSVVSQNLVRFGPYLLDRRIGKLRKHGLKIKLSGQPMEVLLLLLEKPGELVTREELHHRLWRGNVFVDFERGLNGAVKKLRQALTEDPHQPRYIETYSGKGYRFIGILEQEPTTAKDLPGCAVPADTLSAQRPGLPPLLMIDRSQPLNSVAAVTLRSTRWRIALALLVMAAAATFFMAGRFSRRGPTSRAGTLPQTNARLRSSIAVLGFKNLSSHRDDEWLSTAITQMLATELASGDKVRLIPEETVARTQLDLGLKEKDGYARDTLRELRTHLGSDYVVAGSYMAVGDRNSGQVRMDIRLQETLSGETLTSIAVSGKQSEIFDLVVRAGREMRTKLGSSVAPEGDVDWRTVLPSNTEAARLYSEGLSHLRISEDLPATDFLQRSLMISPDFALAHAALAEAWSNLGYDSRALASAQKALSLSNGLPEDERFEIQGRYYELSHDWAGAIGVYRHLWQDYPDDLESGLKLAAAQISAGNINDASATLSNLRSLPAPLGNDPRIDLADASVAAQSADYKRQLVLAEQAEKKAQSSGARLLLARAKLVKGWALDDQSLLKDAVDAYAEARQIFEAAGDRDGSAIALNNLGIVLQKQGDLAGARQKLEQALAGFRQVGDENGAASVLTNLGEVFRAQGDLSRAEDLYREALSAFRKIGRQANEYATMNDLGGVLFQRGDFRGARKLYEELLEVRQAAGDKIGVALAKSNLADVMRVQGEFDRAVGLHEQALATFREIGDRSTMTGVELSLARTLISKQELAAARRTLQEALTANQEIGAKGDAAFDRVMLARVAFLERHPEQFDASVQSAIEELRNENRGPDEIEARAMQAEAFLARGKVNEAKETLENANALRASDWLAKFRLSTTSAQLEAARGNDATAKRKLIAAMTDAKQAGCVVCRTEIVTALSEITSKRQSQAERLP